jgi:hypothetical protein
LEAWRPKGNWASLSMYNSYVKRNIPYGGDMNLYIAVSTTRAIGILFIISNQFPPYFLHYVVNLFENVFCKTVAFVIHAAVISLGHIG